MPEHKLKDTQKNWRAKIELYQTTQTSIAITQLLNSFFPFISLCILRFLTKKEYYKRSRWGKARYQIMRTHLVQIVISPIVYLTDYQRYPIAKIKDRKTIVWPIILNKLLLFIVYGTLMGLLVWQKVLIVQEPGLLIFGSIAFCFFYIQHQQEDNHKLWNEQKRRMITFKEFRQEYSTSSYTY